MRNLRGPFFAVDHLERTEPICTSLHVDTSVLDICEGKDELKLKKQDHENTTRQKPPQNTHAILKLEVILASTWKRFGIWSSQQEPLLVPFLIFKEFTIPNTKVQPLENRCRDLRFIFYSTIKLVPGTVGQIS